MVAAKNGGGFAYNLKWKDSKVAQPVLTMKRINHVLKLFDKDIRKRVWWTNQRQMRLIAWYPMIEGLLSLYTRMSVFVQRRQTAKARKASLVEERHANST